MKIETEKMMRHRLRTIGFSEKEIFYYFRLLAAEKCSDAERLRMLGDKRRKHWTRSMSRNKISRKWMF